MQARFLIIVALMAGCGPRIQPTSQEARLSPHSARPVSVELTEMSQRGDYVFLIVNVQNHSAYDIDKLTFAVALIDHAGNPVSATVSSVEPLFAHANVERELIFPEIDIADVYDRTAEVIASTQPVELLKKPRSVFYVGDHVKPKSIARAWESRLSMDDNLAMEVTSPGKVEKVHPGGSTDRLLIQVKTVDHRDPVWTVADDWQPIMNP